jgi:hypothetical protein
VYFCCWKSSNSFNFQQMVGQEPRCLRQYSDYATSGRPGLAFFFSPRHHIQTRPATLGTRGSFKRPERAADHSLPPSVEVHSPLRLHGVVLDWAQGQSQSQSSDSLKLTPCCCSVGQETLRFYGTRVSLPCSQKPEINLGGPSVSKRNVSCVAWKGMPFTPTKDVFRIRNAPRIF